MEKKGNDMKSLYDLEEKIEEYQEKIAHEVGIFFSNVDEVNASEVGLDRRCGNVFVGSDFIAVRELNKRSIEYYGGFEYINRDHVKQIGEYVIYNLEFDGEWEDRVKRCIDIFNGKYEEMGDDE